MGNENDFWEVIAEIGILLFLREGARIGPPPYDSGLYTVEAFTDFRWLWSRLKESNEGKRLRIFCVCLFAICICIYFMSTMCS